MFKSWIEETIKSPGNFTKFLATAEKKPVAAGPWRPWHPAKISENIILDQNTTVPGYAVARPMVGKLKFGRMEWKDGGFLMKWYDVL